MRVISDEGDRAGVGCCAFQPRLLEQKPRDDAMDDAQHRREQLGMSGEQNAQWNWKRQHPLPDRHARNDLIDQTRGALGHAPRAEESNVLNHAGRGLHGKFRYRY